MIVTCPQCESQFKLAPEALPTEGAKVRCSECGEVWHQEPDLDELIERVEKITDEVEEASQEQEESTEAQDAPAEEIPESVKPLEKRAELAEAQDVEDERRSYGRAVKSYAIAALVFFMVFGILLGMGQTVLSAWPASAAFYSHFGIEAAVPGEGLVFDQINVQAQNGVDGTETLNVSGSIINLTSAPKHVPNIHAVLRGSAEDVLAEWIIQPPQGSVEAEQTLVFNASYEGAQPGGETLFLKFTLTGQDHSAGEAAPKTVSEDADNTQSHAPDGPAHSNVPAEDAESHGHASAPPHPESEHGSPASSPPDPHIPHTAAPADHSASHH